MDNLPQRLGLTVLDGPHRVGSELRWRVQRDGTAATLGQLLPELATDVSVRRRYVRDVDRLRGLPSTALAPLLDSGPENADEPTADPPWRLREHPAGETLEQHLDARAPLPTDEAATLVAALADRLHELHAHGAVVRDLTPAHVVLTPDEGPRLVDVGLARVDILSTRTAASLLLEGSPFSAPELLARTAVDARADVYALGVMLYRALTNRLPFPDTHALLRPSEPPARVRSLRREVPEVIDELVARCLAEDPSDRPAGAAEVAQVLRGTAALAEHAAPAPCQSCGRALPPGQRLCLGCGKLAVQFDSTDDPDDGYDIELRKIDEKSESREALAEILGGVCEGPLPPLNFLVGDARMYSKLERDTLDKLPAKLVTGLTKSSAQALDQRLRDAGLATRLVPTNANNRALRKGEKIGLSAGLGATIVMSTLVAAAIGTQAGFFIAGLAAVVGTVIVLAVFHHRRNRKKRRHAPALVPVRRAPAALPASDPLVARLGALLQDEPPADVREQVGDLALAVQRLVDHRVTHTAEAQDIDVLTAPVEKLVALVETQVHAIAEIDEQLAQHDEGRLVRQLAAAEARREDPATRDRLLDSLDRLRTLEQTRSQRLFRLIEATRLARRSVALGLTVRDEAIEHERDVALALAALSAKDESAGDDQPPLTS